MDAIQPTIAPTPAPKKKYIGLTYGLIGGLVYVVLTLLLYLAGVDKYLSSWGYLGYLVLIVLAVMAGLAVRKTDGGFISFQQAVTACFTVFVIGLAMQALFNCLLLNFIDVNFKNVVQVEITTRLEKSLRSFGFGDNKIDEMMKAQRNTNSFSAGNMTLGLAVYYIVFFILSLIIGAIIKRKREFVDEVR